MKNFLLQCNWYKFLFVLCSLFSFSTQAQTVNTYTTSGTWVCPVGVTSVVVETWGGGGAGGGIPTLTTGAAGGGGGGGYTKAVQAVVPGNLYSYVVGTGGIATTGAGSNGNPSSFNGATATIANGGVGGAGGSNGAGGTGTTGVDFAGGNGAAGVNGSISGAGGGGAGSTSNGGNAAGGIGGTAGGTDGGAGAAGRNSTNNGNIGNTIGGGGSGAYATITTGFLGGNGARGQLRLTFCAAVATNVAALTAAGTYNWASMPWNLGHIPTPCENVLITVDRSAATGNETVTINMAAFTVQNFTLRSLSNTPWEILINTSAPASTFNINGNLVIEAAGLPTSNKYNITTFGVGSGSTINVYGNIVMGRDGALTSATEGMATISGNTSTWMMYGDMIFNPRGYTTNRGTNFIFNKAGTANLVNNTRAIITDTTQPVLFQTLTIGTTNATNLLMSGSSYDGYISRLVNGIINIGTNSTLDMPENYSLNLTGNPVGFPQLIMAAGSKLRLGGDRSIADPFGVAYGVAGSNFPARLNCSFNPTSTVEYYGRSGITQTIYNVPTYANLVASNGPGTGRASKITTATVTANTSINILTGADVTMGANIASVGPFNVQTNGGLYCSTNTVTGAGAFTLNSLGFLGMGSPVGISLLGTATGNVQMTSSRNFSTSGNYIYNNPTTAQITGTGLPATVNDITIDNPTTVTIAANLIVNGVDSLKQGVFNIGSTYISHAGANSRLTSIAGKMKANLGTVEMAGTSGTAQNLSGNWFVNKTISTLLNSNTKGVTVAVAPADTLLIASALLYGGAATSSTITTNDNLTLLSRDTATARFGPMLSSNAIVGNVNVERWLPTTRKWRHIAWNTTSTQTARDSWMEKNAIANGNLVPGYGTIVTDEKSTWATNNFDSKSVSGPSVKYYDMATGLYVGIPNTTSFNMNTYSSYYNFVRGDRSCTPANSTLTNTILRSTGTLKTGNQVFSIPATKFAPVGNPYASAVDIRRLDTLNLTSTFYVWDPKLGGTYGIGAYQMLYQSGADYRVMPGGGTYGALNSIVDTLESGSAFFVRARTLTGTLTFKETSKNIGARAASFTGGEQANAEVSFALLSIVDPGVNTLVDGAMAAFHENFNSAVDFDDALKLTNLSENVSYKRDGQLLAIERRRSITADDTLFLNVTGYKLKKYQWDINLNNLAAAGRTAFFVDKYLNTSQPLSFTTVNVIQFDIVNVVGAYNADRFMIVFKQTPIAPLTFVHIAATRKANNNVLVDWAMQNEKNVNIYTLEISKDGIGYQTLTSQMPTANNGGSPAYNYEDGTAAANKLWYRVKANTTTGSTIYSNAVTVNEVEKIGDELISIYPNPVVNGKINLQLNFLPEGKYNITISNMVGQTVEKRRVAVQGNHVSQVINLANAAAGKYQLSVTETGGKKTTVTFIIP